MANEDPRCARPLAGAEPMRPAAPRHCVLWREPERVNLAQAQVFEPVETYETQAGLVRRLLRCRECGQRYFHESRQEYDRSRGNDPHYDTYTPVASDAEIAALRRLAPPELSRVTPALCRDLRRNAPAPRVCWTGGGRTG